jgi:hypothetical protein
LQVFFASRNGDQCGDNLFLPFAIVESTKTDIVLPNKNQGA